MLADLYRLGWRTELVLQMPRERAQSLGVEILLARRQLRDVTPPGISPLAEDADVTRSLHFYFLTARIPLAAAQVQHLSSLERLAFGSAPLPRVAKATPALLALFAVAPCTNTFIRAWLVKGAWGTKTQVFWCVPLFCNFSHQILFI